MKEENQTKIAILVFGLLFAIIVVGIYLGGEKREIKSEGVKREVGRVENICRRDDFYKESSADNTHKEASTDASLWGGISS